MYFGYLLCVTKENLQNHIPKGIWDTMEGDDVALASQAVARDNGLDESLQVLQYCPMYWEIFFSYYNIARFCTT